MEVEGLTFRATTTSQEDHNANFIDRPKKRNHDERLIVVYYIQSKDYCLKMIKRIKL